MTILGLIYAGGLGTRLGGAIKANIEIGGLRLLERASAALEPTAAPVLVAHGSLSAHELQLLPGQIALPDLASDTGGPLAGLAGAIDWCAAAAESPDLLLTLAVDTPFGPADYAERMSAALDTGENAVVAAFAGQPYPTNALWRVSALGGLPGRLRAGTGPKSLRHLAEELGAAHLDWPDDGRGNPFANVNTPADLAALKARARAR